MVGFKLVPNGTADLCIRDTHRAESFYVYGSIGYTSA